MRQTGSRPTRTCHRLPDGRDPQNWTVSMALGRSDFGPVNVLRLIHFRQRILEKFSTMKSAFETWLTWLGTVSVAHAVRALTVAMCCNVRFAQEHGPHGTTRELTKKEQHAQASDLPSRSMPCARTGSGILTVPLPSLQRPPEGGACACVCVLCESRDWFCGPR